MDDVEKYDGEEIQKGYVVTFFFITLLRISVKCIAIVMNLNYLL